MLMKPAPHSITPDPLHASAARAARTVPPMWPLSSTVAVNPYLGLTHDDLALAGARLARVLGVRATMPRHWYQNRIESGEIKDVDLAAAIAAVRTNANITVAQLKAAARQDRPAPVAIATVADLAAEVSGVDWPGVIEQRIGAWAADYFDAGQALWAAPKGKSAYAAWRAVAIHDLTPEIAGLAGFAAFVADGPDTAQAVLHESSRMMGLSDEVLETYFLRLLMGLGGWSQYARYHVWQAELAGQDNPLMIDLLAIALTWEMALFRQYATKISARWEGVRAHYAAPVQPGTDDIIDACLQEAAERAAQRSILATLHSIAPAPADERPTLQAAFCIDVRSEVFRRALEAMDPGIRTLGFAGFFGLPTNHRGFASDVEERRLPVLLKPAITSRSGASGDARRDELTRVSARAIRAWGRFKLAAVSSFAFVEAMGPIYAGKLLRDSLSFPEPKRPQEPAPRFDPELDVDTRIDTAEKILRAMSLTQAFAPVVLLIGHGANVVNNPYKSALHCGACGGHSGEVNARLLAGLLNDPAVRSGLHERGIEIPNDTLFIGALHDTTTDAVTLFSEDTDAAGVGVHLAKVRRWLAQAADIARTERALRLPRAEGPASILRRSRDWAEIRPEWGLAGCKAFIAAPRSRTAGKKLDGRTFLHDYDWRQDQGFGVLELIMTAPVVVASWISLQYYGSSVAPEVFGAGDKLLHNVTGGIGVVEGNGGMLRSGLPWQSVHDGEKLVHEPLRLAVFIEAPTEAMSMVLEQHAEVRALFDNGWLHLMAINAEGRVHARYAGNLAWENVESEFKAAA
ncbi:MAG: YbcC family protein [Hyphomicrobiaceae bacterium]